MRGFWNVCNDLLMAIHTEHQERVYALLAEAELSIQVDASDEMVEKMWRAVQDNLGKFQRLFGAENMIIVDNSIYGDDILGQIEAKIAKTMNEPVKNPLGKIWIRDAIAAKQGKNRPA